MVKHIKLIMLKKYQKQIHIQHIFNLNNNTSIKIEYSLSKKLIIVKIVDISGEGISFGNTKSRISSLISTHGIKEFLNILDKKVNDKIL